MLIEQVWQRTSKVVMLEVRLLILWEIKMSSKEMDTFLWHAARIAMKDNVILLASPQVCTHALPWQ